MGETVNIVAPTRMSGPARGALAGQATGSEPGFLLETQRGTSPSAQAEAPVAQASGFADARTEGGEADPSATESTDSQDGVAETAGAAVGLVADDVIDERDEFSGEPGEADPSLAGQGADGAGQAFSCAPKPQDSAAANSIDWDGRFRGEGEGALIRQAVSQVGAVAGEQPGRPGMGRDANIDTVAASPGSRVDGSTHAVAEHPANLALTATRPAATRLAGWSISDLLTPGETTSRIAKHGPDRAMISDAMPGQLLPGVWSATAAPLAMMAQGAEAVPAHVQPQTLARQIVDAVVQMQDNQIEIALSPEELGAVRLVLSRGESGNILTVWVDRPEVLEMMRRHSETMLADLRHSGLGDASLDLRDGSGSAEGRGLADHPLFAQGDRRGRSRDGQGSESMVVGVGGGASPADQRAAMAAGAAMLVGRLDIRV